MRTLLALLLHIQGLPTNSQKTRTCCCTCSCYKILCCNMPSDKNFLRKRACVRPRIKEHCAAVAVVSLPLGACREPPLLGSARPLSVHTVFSGPRPVISSSLPLCTSCAFPYARRLSRVHRGTSVLCCRACRSERDQMNPPPEKETANGRCTRTSGHHIAVGCRIRVLNCALCPRARFACAVHVEARRPTVERHVRVSNRNGPPRMKIRLSGSPVRGIPLTRQCVSCSTISQRARFSLASRCGGGPNDSKKGWGLLGFRWALGLVRDRWGSPQRVPNEGSLVTLMQGHSFWATRAADH